jgi:hypothetical protein
MDGFDWPALLEELLSRSSDLCCGAIGGLLAAWLAFRFGTKRDVTKLRAELQRDQEKLRLDGESRVVGQVWRAVQSTLEKVSVLTAPYKQYPDFRFLTGDALEEFLRLSFLSEAQQKELLEAGDRNQYYQRAHYRLELNDARRSLYELDALLRGDRIYIPEKLASTTADLVQTVHGLLASHEVWHESISPQLLKKAREEIKQAQELGAEIERQMRALPLVPIPQPPAP